jgi:hypothetical protein
MRARKVLSQQLTAAAVFARLRLATGLLKSLDLGLRLPLNAGNFLV